MNDQSKKQTNAYIPTLICSTATSALVLAWLYQEHKEPGNNGNPLINLYGTSWHGEIATVFQLVYFVTDCLCMVYVYPNASDSQAWLHHIIYFGYMSWALWVGASNIFLAFAIVEIPTIMLSIGRIWPQHRMDLSLIVVFFVTRILMHGGLAYYMIHTMTQSPLRTGFVGSAGSLMIHIYWLNGFVKSYRKQLLKRSDEEAEFRMGKDE
jgi:hypothetical protein